MNMKSAIIIAAAVLLGAAGVIVQKEMHAAEVRRTELQLAERAKLKELIKETISECNWIAERIVRAEDATQDVAAFKLSSYNRISALDRWMDGNRKDDLAPDVLALRNEIEALRREYAKFDPKVYSTSLPVLTGRLERFAAKL